MQSKIIFTIIFVFTIKNISYAKNIPDFSDLASQLIPSVVSVSVDFRDVSPNRPVPPQFPPGSPPEDFSEIFLKEEGCLVIHHQDKEEMKQLLVQDL